MHPFHSPGRPSARGLLLFATLVLAGTASAIEPVPHRVAGFGLAVEASSLAELRGGNDVENDVDINGVVGGNHAEDITSGTNTLAGDAFANANGINTVIQNSGSNVLIQNGMVVNVQFTPSP